MSGSITLLCGLPGCGKSTFLEDNKNIYDSLPTRQGAEKVSSVVLCPDDFRRALTGQDYYAPAEDSIWSHVKIAARVLVAKNDIIIDATHLTIGSRSQWIRMAQALKVPIRCVRFDVPFEVCWERNSARKRVVPLDVMERMRDSFEVPTLEEGFERIKTIATETLQKDV